MTRPTLAVLALLLALPPAPRAATVPAPSPRAESIKLTWSAVGDDSLTGKATSYDLRFSRAPLTTANFDIAPRWRSMPTPAAPGTRQSVTVDSLEAGALYYFAIRAIDDANNAGKLSNVIERMTPGPPDSTIPTRIILRPLR